MIETPDSVFEKIRKLLKLSEDTSTTIGEIEAASAMAQKLMDKYRVSIKDIPVEQRKETISMVDFSDSETGRLRTWKMSMISMIGQLNGCVVLKSSRASVRLVGSEANREITKYLSVHCIRQVQSLANSKWNQVRDSCGMIYSTYTQHFGLGAVSSIKIRMVKERENGKEVNSIILYDENVVKDWISKNVGGLKTGKMRTKLGQASIDGYNAGAQVSWNKGIKTTVKAIKGTL